MPDSAKGSRAPDRDSGESTPASSRRPRRRSSSSKTSPASCVAASLKSFPILPACGSMRSGVISPLPPLELHTDGGDSSCWPTATASRCGSSNNNKPTPPRLSLDAIGRRWPTPCTTDAASAARGTTTTGVMHPGETLTDAMRSRAFPPAQTTSPAGTDGSTAMVLNPDFVEALMGLPPGWTVLDAASAFEAVEMRLCPGRQLRLFES